MQKIASFVMLTLIISSLALTGCQKPVQAPAEETKNEEANVQEIKVEEVTITEGTVAEEATETPTEEAAEQVAE